MNWYRLSQMHDKVVAVDFDETIASKAEYPEIGKPIKGVQEALKRIQEAGYKIRIYTCRMNGHNLEEEGEKGYQAHKKRIEDYLEKYEIPYDDIADSEEGKIFAEFYVDDKSVEFDGSWEKVLKKIL